MAKTSYQKSAKPESWTFAKAFAALLIAKAKPWGENIIWSAADHANEDGYLYACDRMRSARVTCRADVMAAIDYINEEEIEEWPLQMVLAKIRFFEELGGLSPAVRKAFKAKTAAARARLKKAA